MLTVRNAPPVLQGSTWPTGFRFRRAQTAGEGRPSLTLVTIAQRAGGPPRTAYRPPRPPLGGGSGPRPGGAGRGRLPVKPVDDGPPTNEEIKCANVRLLDENKQNVGVVSIEDARAKAEALQLDLVMISPDADPPVCRIVDYSKYKFELEKAKKEQKKKAMATRVEQKELKMRYNIDSHDYDVRLRAAQDFLRRGDKVKLTVQFRGREMEFKDLASKLFEKFIADVGEDGAIESRPMMEGRSMITILAPSKISLDRLVANAAKKAASKSDEAVAV